MEVALAATVLALTLTGMIQVVTSGTEMLDLSRKQTIALQILHGEIDQLRIQSWPTLTGYNTMGSSTGTGYPSLPTTLTSANDPALAALIAASPQIQSIYTLTRSVTSVQPYQDPQTSPPYTSAPQLLQVTFTITWTGATGHTYSRTSTTLVGANGLFLAYQRS